MNTKKECPNELIARTRPACKATISGIAYCSICGQPVCPVCGRHNVVQLSRITGYISNVQGWNEGKKQELKDRIRYEINHSTPVPKNSPKLRQSRKLLSQDWVLRETRQTAIEAVER